MEIKKGKEKQGTAGQICASPMPPIPHPSIDGGHRSWRWWKSPVPPFFMVISLI
jgi:hypothetical protein